MPSYSSLALSLSPIAYWRCGEASGNLADSSTNSATGTMTAQGSATYSATGPLKNDSGKAITLDGVNANYFSNTGDASLDMDNIFSVAGWFKKAENGRIMSILTCANNGFLFQINDSNQITLGQAGVDYIVKTVTTITDTNWHMAVITKTGNTTKIYYEGIEVSTTFVSNRTIATSDTSDLNIGRTVGFNSQNWNGSLAEIELWNRVLTDSEIRSLYHMGKSLSMIYRNIRTI